MKKSLIALAALGAFAGAASAQSSVTLYGTLDVGVAKATGLGLTAWGVNGSSFHTPSRFGIRGTEDLGGGLNAIFDLQTGGFGLGNGAFGGNGGLTFGREAYVGLAGGFGTVKAGLDVSLGTAAFGAINLNGISTSDAAAAVGINPVMWYGSSRRPAFVSYTSPNISGLTAALGYTLKGTLEDVLAQYDKASTQARVSYVAGPLTLAAALETARNTDTATAKYRTAYALGAKFDAPAFVVSGSYVVSETEKATYKSFAVAPATNQIAATANGGKGFTLGGAAKLGAAQVGVQLAKNSESDDTGMELFANYALSKRTTLYADFLQAKYDGNGDKKVKKLGLGVQHNF